jgi:hypothetical protein
LQGNSIAAPASFADKCAANSISVYESRGMISSLTHHFLAQVDHVSQPHLDESMKKEKGSWYK